MAMMRLKPPLLFLIVIGNSHLTQGQVEPLDLPLPRAVIVGQTGAGKSTLANVLLGSDPNCKNCTFPICDDHESCTKNTNYASGQWLGLGDVFTVVDTPGFGDSDNDDTKLIDEMMGALHTTIKGANAIVLLLNGEDERFDASLQQMIREMQALFGEKFWNNTLIGVSHWKFDHSSINERNHTGKSEEKFMADMNELLQGKFHMAGTLDGVFIDAWSQQEWNLEDEDQQAAYQRETEKLWNFLKGHDVFPFRTLEDVLKENQELKEEVRWSHDVITHNITELTNAITELTASHQEDMLWVQNEISKINDAPIGTILSWVTKPTSDGEALDLPEGWIRCDGTTIPHPSIWQGKTTPNLNGEKRFLRGGPDSSALFMEDDQLMDHDHIVSDPGHEHDIDDNGHTHGITDNGHDHTVTDSGHDHGYIDKYPFHGTGDAGIGPATYDEVGDRFDKSHNEKTDNTTANIEVVTAYTGISARQATTGIGIKSKSSGITVGKVSPSYRTGSETRVKNMSIIFIMKIW